MLLPDTEIEIIAIKNGKYYKQIMTVWQWQHFKKKKGFRYKAYELGFSQYKTEN
jgi:hypothetical protein